MSDDIARFLLRCITTVGAMPMHEIEVLIRNRTGGETHNIPELVRILNTRIQPFQQAIKIVIDELSQQEMLIFIYLTFDSTTKAQTLFSPAELEYFRCLMEEIMTSDTIKINKIYALNLVKGSNFTKVQAEKTLDKWCRTKYLVSLRDEFALGIRAIHEFESYMRQVMPDYIEECILCKMMVYWAISCIFCGKFSHISCLYKFTKKTSKWPCCKTKFETSHLKNSQSRISSTDALAAFKESSSVNVEEETSESMSNLEISQTQRGRKRKRHS